MLRIWRLENPCAAAKQDVPEPPPIVLVVVDEKSRVRIVAHVLQAGELPRVAFRLGIDRVVNRVAKENEADRNEPEPIPACRRDVPDASGRYLPSNSRRNQAHL